MLQKSKLDKLVNKLVKVTNTSSKVKRKQFAINFASILEQELKHYEYVDKYNDPVNIDGCINYDIEE